jgi:hypothetical protein
LKFRLNTQRESEEIGGEGWRRERVATSERALLLTSLHLPAEVIGRLLNNWEGGVTRTL